MLQKIWNWIKSNWRVLVAVGVLLGYFLAMYSLMSSRDGFREELKKTCEVQDKRDAIQKTLLVAYPQIEFKDEVWGVSQFEALVYAYIFQHFSIMYDIDWELFAALAYVESRFNATALSPAGAKGLLQLMEPTMKEQCKKLGLLYKEDLVVWYDLFNIYAGIDYLAQGFKDSGEGHSSILDHALKRYVGGAGYINIKKAENVKYVDDYAAQVKREYVKLQYIFKGVLNGLD